MTAVSWSRCGDEDCIRIEGIAPGADIRVHTGAPVAMDGLPGTAGRLLRDGDGVCFAPRFAFIAGTAYTVVVDGATAGALVRPAQEHPATTEVLAVYPTETTVPRNLLRCYVWFSAPMSEGYAADHVRLVDHAGETMVGALLAGDHELWDATHRRLTILFDPARIKRGLVPHRQAGYPLQVGASFRLVIDPGFRDALGTPLRAEAERSYQVKDDERGHVNPGRWTLTVPRGDTKEALEIAFERPLDHGLIGRCLHVIGPDGRPVAGTVEIGPRERSWRLVPRNGWAYGSHQLAVDPVLEDVAGNSVSRVFDRDLARLQDRPVNAPPPTLTFRPH